MACVCCCHPSMYQPPHASALNACSAALYLIAPAWLQGQIVQTTTNKAGQTLNQQVRRRERLKPPNRPYSDAKHWQTVPQKVCCG
jgi:hypothetical protein